MRKAKAKAVDTKATKVKPEVVQTDIGKLLKSVTADIEKDFVTSNYNREFQFLSTGNPGINYALSGRADGGFAVSLLTEIAGDNSCVTDDTLLEVQEEGVVKLLPLKEVRELLDAGKKIRVNGPAGFQPVRGWVDKGLNPSLRITLESGNFIKCTKAHRFFKPDVNGTPVDPTDENSVHGFWVQAGQVSIGDKLLNADMEPESVVLIEDNGVVPIYDIKVDHPSHAYFAGGFVNHNTGKTLLGLNALIETQKKNGVAVLIDVERAFNPQWFEKLGGDLERLIHYEPDHIDDSYAFIKKVVDAVRKKDKTCLITVLYDSIAAGQSKFEFEGAEHDMGKRAIAHGKGMRLMMGLAKRENVTAIFINQYRQLMNVMYGPDKDTVGGQGIKYAMSVRVSMKKGKKIETKSETGGKKVIGVHGRLVVEKNRVRAPFAEATFDIYFDRGIDPLSGLFDVLVGEGIIEPRKNAEGGISKGWWTYAGENFRESELPEILKKHPELLGGHQLIDVPVGAEIVDDGPDEDTEVERDEDGFADADM